MKKELEENQSFWEKVKRETGETELKVGDYWWVGGALLIERMRGLPLPAWVDDATLQHFKDYNALQFALMGATEEMARLAMGNLLGEIREELAKKANGTAHYGTKPGHFETSKIHFPTSEGVSEVSERANE